MRVGKINSVRRIKQVVVILAVCYISLVIIPFILQGTHFEHNRLKLQAESGTFFLEFVTNSTPKGKQIISSTTNQMIEKCNKLKYSYKRKINDDWFINGLLKIQKFNMSFCRVPKGASTFLTRLLVCLERDIMKPPFIYKPYDGSVLPKYNFNSYGLKKLYKTLENTHNFMFSRNPYSRVYSFYVDKLFSPNPHYWNSVGVPITTSQRSRSSCGHDIKFREYIQYILDNPVGKREYHIVPINDVCRPCHVKYDFIGKLENFESDLKRMLTMLKMEHYPYFNTSFKKEFSADAANDIIHAFISFIKSAEKCMSRYSLLQRVWRVLQLRGFVSESMQLPVAENEAKLISYPQLTKIVIEVADKSNKNDLKNQKHDYMVQAFLSIPIDMMHKLHDVYKEDLILFGYEEYPKDLFQARPNKIKDVFKT